MFKPTKDKLFILSKIRYCDNISYYIPIYIKVLESFIINVFNHPVEHRQYLMNTHTHPESKFSKS